MSQLITIDDLTAYSPDALDSGRAQQVVDAVNQFIETYTNRCWGETKSVTERYTWIGTVWLRHQDVVEVSAVTSGWPGQAQSTMAATGYYLNPLGRVTFWNVPFINSSRYRDYLAITYEYGQEDVPDDLKLAALAIALGFYNYVSNGGQDIVSTQVGSYRVEFSGAVRGAGVPDPAKNTQDANWAVIDSYRQRRA
jgi:hypothetical protein